MANTKSEVDLYRRKLMDDLQLSGLSPEQEREYGEKIDKLVDNRLKALMLIYLDQDGVSELSRLWETGKEDEIQQFLVTNIPDWNDKVIDELFNIREELIDKTRNYGKSDINN